MGFNKISLCGGQICDYLYIQNSQLDPNNQIEINPFKWDKSFDCEKEYEIEGAYDIFVKSRG